MCFKNIEPLSFLRVFDNIKEYYDALVFFVKNLQNLRQLSGFQIHASDWGEGGRGWCAQAGILCLLTLFASLRPLFYNKGWWSIWKCGKNAIEWKIIIFNLFIFIRLKKKVPSNLIIQLYDWNESCQKYHFEEHWSPWSTFQEASFSPQESPKFSRLKKSKDLTNLTDISDFVIECFHRDKSCQKWYFKQLISPW